MFAAPADDVISISAGQQFTAVDLDAGLRRSGRQAPNPLLIREVDRLGRHLLDARSILLQQGAVGVSLTNLT